MTNTTYDYMTDRYGFPMIPCERCMGVGVLRQHGAIMDGVCFSCKGRKGHYPKGRAGDIARKFQVRVVEERTRICTSNLLPGMTVLSSNKWRTVESIVWGVEYHDVTFKDGVECSFDREYTFYLPADISREEIAEMSARSRALFEATRR